MTFNSAACFDAFKMNPIPPKGPDSLDDEGDEEDPIDPNHVKPKFDNEPTANDDSGLDCPKLTTTE
jgi:hypothetical protein